MGWIWGKNLKHIIIVMAFLIFQIGCGSDGGGGDSGSGGSDQGGSSSVVSALSISSSQDSVEPGKSLDFTVKAFDQSGNPVQGASIALVLDDPIKGAVTPKVTTGSNGSAKAEFAARDISGSLNITASSNSVETSKKVTILNQNAPFSITLEANPTEILASKSSTITATVKDSNGNPVVNGTIISFSVKNSSFGSITSEAVTNAGKASATFVAAANPGTAEITASSGSASKDINVIINSVGVASIEFDSVSHNPVAIKGSIGQQSTEIKFNVKDKNGNKAKDVSVKFTISGPNGGEYIEDNDSTPNEAIVSTVDGVAKATFHSGGVAGTVTVTAEIDKDEDGNYETSAKAPIISIGGGIPAEDRFSVSAESWNLAGLATDDIQTKVKVMLADRFGNYNILDGHEVSFKAGNGIAIDTSGKSDSKGIVEVYLRTQGGQPYAEGSLTIAPWELSLRNNLETEYGYDFEDAHPRLGFANFLSFTRGEEKFEDGSNGKAVNGIYDDGENYTDTIHEPFLDLNENNLWNDGSGTDPYEEYTDENGNKSHDGVNGKWDEDKYIFHNSYIVTTGRPIIRFLSSDDNYNILNGEQKDFVVLVCDPNMNRISNGSTIEFSVDGGKIKGVSSYSADSRRARGDSEASQRSAILYTVTLGDEDEGEILEKASSLSCTVKWNKGGSVVTVGPEKVDGKVH